MSDSKARVAVHRVDILNGRVLGTTSITRNVFTRRDGSHYIVTLGSRVPVTRLDDANFLEVQEARSVAGGIMVGHS